MVGINVVIIDIVLIYTLALKEGEVVELRVNFFFVGQVFTHISWRYVKILLLNFYDFVFDRDFALHRTL